ncbi:response regulator [Roseateles sp. DC23W]|uniref:Response regulator n=1 Tax=Pelomonas dachongensis TaxID=3299029 RepID=A0ABW7EJ58_9BURK
MRACRSRGGAGRRGCGTPVLMNLSLPLTRARPRLLLIDDDPGALRELVAILQSDFDVQHALDGRSGLHRAQALRPDLILLDVVMPGADGHVVCRLLKADASTRDIPVIFLTGMHAVDDRLQGLALGAVDYVGKPFAAAEVRARVYVHLRLAGRLTASDADLSVSEGAEPASFVQVQAAMRYIAEHLADLPTVSQIAQSVGTHEVRLLALFRQQLGLTVSGYIAEERVRTGCRLLVETQMSVQEIATEVGYSSPGNFISAFKERMGVTPRAWRESDRPALATPAAESRGLG